MASTQLLWAGRTCGPLGTFTTVTKSRRHDYKSSPFIKKRICHYSNSQTNNNLIWFDLQLFLIEIGWPRTNISFLLSRPFSQSLTSDSLGRQRASENHSTWTGIKYFIHIFTVCNEIETFKTRLWPECFTPIGDKNILSARHSFNFFQFSLKEFLLFSSDPVLFSIFAFLFCMDRDTRICLPNSKTLCQEKICVAREVSKEILPVTDREWDFSGSNENIHLDISKKKNPI